MVLKCLYGANTSLQRYCVMIAVLNVKKRKDLLKSRGLFWVKNWKIEKGGDILDDDRFRGASNSHSESIACNSTLAARIRFVPFNLRNRLPLCLAWRLQRRQTFWSVQDYTACLGCLIRLPQFQEHFISRLLLICFVEYYGLCCGVCFEHDFMYSEIFRKFIRMIQR